MRGYDEWLTNDPNDVDPEATVECSVCGGDVPATLEWADPDYEAVAEFHCSECGEPRCEDCRCKCEVEEDEIEDPTPLAPVSPIIWPLRLDRALIQAHSVRHGAAAGLTTETEGLT